MIERLLLLFDCGAEEAIERIAGEIGYAHVPNADLRAALDEVCSRDGRWRVLSAGNETHQKVPALLSALGEIPEPLRPFVLIFVEDPRDIGVLRDNAEIDSVLQLPATPARITEALKPARRFLRLQTQYRRHALHDPLTGVLNRRAVLDMLTRELRRAERQGYAVSIAMIDIDQYKLANDSLGHIGGDAAMVSLTARITSQLRPYDIVGRYGGDEFLLVLSNCGLEQAQVICERIRASIAASPVSAGGKSFPLTVSIGIAGALALEKVTDCDLIQRADMALYEAKNTGRDRVVMAR